MNIAGRTDIGCKRPENQDNFRAGRLPCGAAFAFVCDGMGGAVGGKLASDMLCSSMEDIIYEKLADATEREEIKELMLDAVLAGNREIYALSIRDKNKLGMGTTVVAAVIRDGLLHLVNVGDSRCYLLRNGILQLLTKDHSIVQDLLDNGEVSLEQARIHPKKNLITRAVGVGESVDLDYTAYEISPGDKLLLCSDGLTNCADESAIQMILQTSPFFDITDKLIKLAKTGGGLDNITTVVIAMPKIVR